MDVWASVRLSSDVADEIEDDVAMEDVRGQEWRDGWAWGVYGRASDRVVNRRREGHCE